MTNNTDELTYIDAPTAGMKKGNMLNDDLPRVEEESPFIMQSTLPKTVADHAIVASARMSTTKAVMQRSESNLNIDPENLNSIYEKYLILLQEDATAKVGQVLL